ncbi:SMP-30/gluconolactonase/LRE family protein [Microbulbifer thermotolerans]|nr:SMP-30/gluconolactonase/LRE family protein [Microbulbifer thermotolerans]
MQFELIDTLPTACGLGESTLWHSEHQAIYWTDMPNNQLIRYFPENGRKEVFPTAENLCSFAFIEKSDWLLCAFQSGIARFQPETQALEWIFRLPQNLKVRLNDGRMDRQGRFWVGSLIDTPDLWAEDPAQRGKLYCLDSDGNVTEHLDDIRISNGLGWSPDSRTMYFADSPRYAIYAFDFAPESGQLSNRRLFATTEEGVHADGSTVDIEGHVWNAQWGNGKVVRYAPDGSVAGEIHLPVQQATCVGFGGPERNLLFVNTAKFGLDADALRRQPQAGHLFIYATDTRGMEEKFYPG